MKTFTIEQIRNWLDKQRDIEIATRHCNEEAIIATNIPAPTEDKGWYNSGKDPIENTEY